MFADHEYMFTYYGVSCFSNPVHSSTSSSSAIGWVQAASTFKGKPDVIEWHRTVLLYVHSRFAIRWNRAMDWPFPSSNLNQTLTHTWLSGDLLLLMLASFLIDYKHWGVGAGPEWADSKIFMVDAELSCVARLSLVHNNFMFFSRFGQCLLA